MLDVGSAMLSRRPKLLEGGERDFRFRILKEGEKYRTCLNVTEIVSGEGK
jgi:hypothetical protein